MDDVDKVKAKLNIVDLISSYVSLKRSGRNLFGLCPFHSETTPSFAVNEEVGRFKCFGCGVSGDSIEFIKLYNNVDFPEALEMSAKLAGVELTKTYKRGNKDLLNRLTSLNKTASDIYSYILLSHSAGKKYLEYLKNRKLNDEIIKEFKLGCVPKTGIIDILLKKGFTPKELVDYGFAVERYGGIKDKFRGRVIFPVTNNIGEVIGFTGRLINKDDYGPKYLNTPQTPLYKKKEILYGLYQAKKEIAAKDNVLILEGHMDVLASYQAGVTNVVGVQGTSLGEEHLNVLKRYTKNISFAFDIDNAGENALTRSIFIAEKLGFDIRIIDLENEKDPDEFIQHNEVAVWREKSEHPSGLIDYFIKKWSIRYNLSDINQRVLFINKISPFISQIQDRIKKDHYMNQLSLITDTSVENITAGVTTPQKGTPSITISLPKQNLTKEEYLIALIIQNLSVANELDDQIDREIFSDENVKKILTELLNKSVIISSIDYPLLTDLYIRDLNLNLDNEGIKKEMLKTLQLLKRANLHNQISKNKREIALAENTGDLKKAQSLLVEVKELI